MPEKLKSNRNQYAEEGYTIFRDVLDRGLLDEINQHLEWLRLRPGGQLKANLYAAPVKDDPFWTRLAADDRLLDLVEMLIGPDIILFSSTYAVKWPVDGMPALWHQDGPSWPLEPVKAVTLWLAVDDADRENGCLRVIPGSHRLDLKDLQPNNSTPNLFGWETAAGWIQDELALDLELNAGDVSAHHPNLLHASWPNYSNRRRAGLSTRYIPADVKIKSNGPWPNALLLRGYARPDLNICQPRPHYVEGLHMPFQGCEEWQ